MGAEPWQYFVSFEEDIEAALQKLRRKEFEAGRFRGSETRPGTPEEAFENMVPDGTASILDVTQISESPDFCAVGPLPKEVLLRLFRTDKPTHEMIEANLEFFEEIDRGQGVYIIVYKNEKPSELFFAGLSFD